MENVTKDDLKQLEYSLLARLGEMIQAIKLPERPDDSKWVKSGKVKAILDLSPGTLQKLRISGVLHPKKIGGSYYYSMAEIRKILTSKGGI